MTQTLALEMIRITKTFGAFQALVDADLKVAKGTVHGLVGQNGTGKSGEGARPRQGPRRLRLRLAAYNIVRLPKLMAPTGVRPAT
jgi:hypothetical protein